MNKNLLLSALGAIVMSGCASQENACRDITEISEKAQQCESLRKEIDASKNSPLKLSELDRRYQLECVDMLYYRSDRQEAVCDNKEQIEAIIREEEAKADARAAKANN